MNTLGQEELDSHFEKLYLKLLNFLALKARTESEISRKLEGYLLKLNLYEADKARLKLKLEDTLREQNYLNDENYVRDFLLSAQMSSRPKSIGKIKQFLRAKGISPLLLEGVTEASGGLSDEESAVKQGSRLLKRLEKYDLTLRRKKLTGLLVSRGYQWSAVKAAVDTLLPLK